MRLLWPLGMSFLAGVGIGYLINPIAGFIAGSVFFSASVYMAVTSLSSLKTVTRVINFLDPTAPKDTPEI